ncbi:MAG: hypothetical protein ACI89D_002687, partial [Bermanella sp.]
QLHNESIMSNLKETGDSVKDSFKSMEGEFRQTQQQLKSLEYDISDVVKPAPDIDESNKLNKPSSNDE